MEQRSYIRDAFHGGLPKYKTPQNVFDAEASMRTMIPQIDHSVKLMEELIKKKIDTLKASEDENKVELMKAYVTQLAILREQQSQESLTGEYINEFYLWLEGKSKYNDPKRTPWGRKPLAGASIKEFLREFYVAKHNFILRVAMLRGFIPQTIDDAWLYYKFFVNAPDILSDPKNVNSKKITPDDGVKYVDAMVGEYMGKGWHWMFWDDIDAEGQYNIKVKPYGGSGELPQGQVQASVVPRDHGYGGVPPPPVVDKNADDDQQKAPPNVPVGQPKKAEKKKDQTPTDPNPNPTGAGGTLPDTTTNIPDPKKDVNQVIDDVAEKKFMDAIKKESEDIKLLVIKDDPVKDKALAQRRVDLKLLLTASQAKPGEKVDVLPPAGLSDEEKGWYKKFIARLKKPQ